MTDAAASVRDGLDQAKIRYTVDSSTLAPDDPRYPGMAFYTELERRIPPGPPTRQTVRVEADAQAYWKDQVTDDFVERLYQIALLPQRQASQQCRDRVAPNIWMPSLDRQKQETFKPRYTQ